MSILPCFLAYHLALSQAPLLFVELLGAQPKVVSAARFATLPHQTVTFREHDGTISAYSGVPLAQILEASGMPMGDKVRGPVLRQIVVARGSDGYTVSFGLGEVEPSLSGRLILVADSKDGKPLGKDLGPIRLVAAGDSRGARSVRMLMSLRVVDPGQ